MDAADSTALVDGVEGEAVGEAVGEAGELVVVVVVEEGAFGRLNRLLNGLLNTLFVLVLEDANELKGFDEDELIASGTVIDRKSVV